LFSQFIGSTIFDDLTDNDLIIKTKIVEKTGKDGKAKKYKEIVPYTDSVKTRMEKNIINKVNQHLDDQTLKVIAEDLNLKIKINDNKNNNSNFLEDLLHYSINN